MAHHTESCARRFNRRSLAFALLGSAFVSLAVQALIAFAVN